MLDSDPGGDVTVAITMGTSTTAPITVESTPALPLTFTSANWADSSIRHRDGHRGCLISLVALRTLMHTVTGYGDVVTAESVEVRVIDNDRATLTFSPPSRGL